MQVGVPSFDIRVLYQRNNWTLLKIPFFVALWVGLGVIAWNSHDVWVDVACYIGMGYMHMGMATFLHECTHNVLFLKEWKNWAFGIIGFLTLIVPYVAYRDDHLLHHRYNRTRKDTAAFTMGKRGVFDFVVFYAYIFCGVPILVANFVFVHPFLYLKGKKFILHWAEMIFHVAVYLGIGYWAAKAGTLPEVLRVALWPLLAFGLMNSARFLAEHHGTPWEKGQIAGTRTVISNRVNSWFWNNINYHIGHHVYPAVPWYNLKKLHEMMLPRIQEEGGVIDQSYLAVFWKAFVEGPETPERANRSYHEKPIPILTPA